VTKRAVIDAPDEAGLQDLQSWLADEHIPRFLASSPAAVVTGNLKFDVAAGGAGGALGRELREGDVAKAEFIMLKDAAVYFDGTAAQLRASADPYLKRFLADPARDLVVRAA